MIPVANFDPVAAEILSFFPHPTDPTALTNNFQTVVSTPRSRNGTWQKWITQISRTICSLWIDFSVSQNLTFDSNACATWALAAPDRHPTIAISRTGSRKPGPSVRPSSTNFALEPCANMTSISASHFRQGFSDPDRASTDLPVVTLHQHLPQHHDAGSSGGVTADHKIANAWWPTWLKISTQHPMLLRSSEAVHTLKIGGELDRQFQHDQGWGNYSSGDLRLAG